MGFSVGHWEGDTLVVESTGFKDTTWLDMGGHPHTEALRITERFQRRDFGHMDLRVTIDDPKAYAKPWTIAATINMVPIRSCWNTCAPRTKRMPRIWWGEQRRNRR